MQTLLSVRSPLPGALLGLAVAASPSAFAQESTLGSGEVPVESEIPVQTEIPVRQPHGVQIIYGIEPADRRVDLETERYSVQSQERQDLRREVQHIIRIYRDVLGVRVPKDFGVDLEIHGERSSFEKKIGVKGPIAGLYRHDQREAIVSGDVSRSRTQTHGTALHESSHAILMDQVPDVPRWLNEGLAEYFEDLQATAGGRGQVAARPERHVYLQRLHANDQLAPLEPITEFNQWLSLPPRAIGLAYDQSWSFVYFMMERRTTRAVLAGVLQDFRDGTATSSRESLARHHAGGLEDLEQKWHAWLRKKPRNHSH